MGLIWRCFAWASVGISMGAFNLPAKAQSVCADGGSAPAVLISFEGSVRIQRAGGETVAPALDLALCPGDRIATGDASGIDLRFDEKDSVTNILSSSTVVIPPRDEADITLSGGLMRFISSVRGAFLVRTPNTDAGIDGTEAMLAVSGPATDTLVLVREGVVTVSDRRGAASLSLAAGQASYASANTALVRATPENVPGKFRGFLLNPEGAADWAVYYPPILLGAGARDQTIERAAALLDAGEPDRAENLLSAYQGDDLGNALALRSMAAIFRNRPDDGARLADEAVAAAPMSGAGYIAQSYAAQATGNLGQARDAAQQATQVAPEDAYAWARLAELQLTIGHRRGALDAARKSLGLAETSLAHAVLGFAHLSAKDRDLAEASFNNAIRIDSEDPLPRLGLGLSLISRGDLEPGRREIETATSLDPQRAQLRTWLGRAYAEERLGEKAQAQYGLAIEQDPDDPAAWQFLAEQYFAANRPVEALNAINEANARGRPAPDPARCAGPG